jgi:hypothetical protein
MILQLRNRPVEPGRKGPVEANGQNLITDTRGVLDWRRPIKNNAGVPFMRAPSHLNSVGAKGARRQAHRNHDYSQSVPCQAEHQSASVVE